MTLVDEVLARQIHNLMKKRLQRLRGMPTAEANEQMNILVTTMTVETADLVAFGLVLGGDNERWDALAKSIAEQCALVIHQASLKMAADVQSGVKRKMD